MSQDRDPSILAEHTALVRRAQAERAEVVRTGICTAARWVSTLVRSALPNGTPHRRAGA